MRESTRDKCRSVMRDVFGVSEFRPGQERAVECILSGRDTLCLFPTGAGKSLCYQLPALIMAKPALIISPLVALMRDQVKRLQAHGICAVCLESGQSPEEREQLLHTISEGAAPLIYIAPERLGHAAFDMAIRRHPPGMVVVDEAHCVVTWGENFRPAYQRIGRWIAELPERPVIAAMTATADRPLRAGIVSALGMRRAAVVSLPLIRPNLRMELRTALDPLPELKALLARHPNQRGIVFCRTRKRTETLAAMLRGWKDGQGSAVKAEAYHAGMTREERVAVELRFQHGQTLVVVATTAFGMGIDIPDIRFTAHDALPDDMVQLSQEIGRAGRDGLPSECLLLLCPADVERRRRAIQAARKTAGTHLRKMYSLWKAWRAYRRVLALCLEGDCLSAGMTKAFGERAKPCGQCSACRQHGRPSTRVPDLWRMNEADLRFWVLQWQLRAYADTCGVTASSILSAEALHRAAYTLTLDVSAPPEAHSCLDRLLDSMRGKSWGETHVKLR